MATKKKSSSVVEIGQIRKETARFFIVGDSPYMSHAMSEKALHELLMPSGRMTVAQKARTLKHNPLREFRQSCYLLSSKSHPTAVGVPAVAFKSALRGAALDIPGSTKAQVGRLTYVRGNMVNLFGIPEMNMGVVRMSDAARTPDVRTRAVFPRWAATIEVDWVDDIINYASLCNLLAAAGITQGVGDGRPEKGKLSYGQFHFVRDDDPEFLDILSNGGRGAQISALQSPTMYDDETARLYGWFNREAQRRGYDLGNEFWELGLDEVGVSITDFTVTDLEEQLSTLSTLEEYNDQA